MAKQKTIKQKRDEVAGLSEEERKKAEEQDKLAEEAAVPKKSTQEDVDALLAQGINPVGRQGIELLSGQERTGENAADAARQAVEDAQAAEEAQKAGLPEATALTGTERLLEKSPGIQGIAGLAPAAGTIAGAGTAAASLAAAQVASRGLIAGAIGLAGGATAGLITAGIITGSQFATRARLSGLGNAITELDKSSSFLKDLPPEEALANIAQMEVELNRIERSVKAVGKHDVTYFVQDGIKQGSQINSSREKLISERRNALLKIAQNAALQSQGVLQ